MKVRPRFTVVIVGYAAAFLAAWGASALWQARTQGPEVQASSGLYAFGDSVLFFGVLLVVALVPTVLGFSIVRTLAQSSH